MITMKIKNTTNAPRKFTTLSGGSYELGAGKTIEIDGTVHPAFIGYGLEIISNKKNIKVNE